MKGKGWLLAICGVGVLGVAGYLRSGPPQPIPAFTATEVEIIYEGHDTVLALTLTPKTIAVRGDGSFAYLYHHRAPFPNVWTLARRDVTDVSEKMFFQVDPFSESVSSYRLSKSVAAYSAKTYRGTCEGQSAGEILGYEVVLTERTVPQNNPLLERIVTRRWLAPRLFCFPLRTEMLVFADGKMTQRTIKSVTYLVEGEPASWIFSFPTNYTERSPSAAALEAQRRFPNDECCKHGAEGLEMQDEAYYRHREMP